ncbi:MAG: nitroreductase family protein [Lachnospiraceae bacterium]|jgi:nitroreductase|nr:nitroreductase family protein [Lachnospiraceae bacterium]MEE3462245.1 nitroreductase family protein [Lachnospiraceae bacterium]
MDFIELIRNTRSTRRFLQSEKISIKDLHTLVRAASLCPSALNRQPMKYIVSNNGNINAEIFKNLIWAPYIKDWDGPVEGQRPAAYLIMVLDKELSPSAEIDAGIQAQSILLCAKSMGISGCMLEKINKPEIAKIFELSDRYEVQLVIALGKGAEDIIMEPVVREEDGGHGIKFYHDTEGRHHVPKRSAEEITLREYF